jgi:hypothetical protein
VPAGEIYSHIRVLAHTPFTGQGAGHESVEKNIEAFKKAVNLALAEVKKLKDGDDVLPIFVAPEWTWKAKTGFYDPDDLAMIYTFLTVTSKSNPEVLFFPGSVLWGLKGDEGADVLKKAYPLGDTKVVAANLASKKGHRVLYNSVPVFFEGKLIHNLNQQFEDTAKTGMERFDFEPGPGKGTAFWKTVKGEGADVDWVGIVRQGSQFWQDGKFAQGTKKKSFNIQWGLETGIDNTYKLLKSLNKKLDVQVILSCGVTPEKDSVAPREDGLLIHCDGNNQDKKLGLQVLQVENPLPAPVACNFFGDNQSAVAIVKKRLPLNRLLMKADAKGPRPAKLRAQDYLDFRKKTAMLKPDELKEIFTENLERAAKWVKIHKQIENSVLNDLLAAGTWDSPAWKKNRGILEDGSYPADVFSAFDGSAFGIGLGFFIGVNAHLDAMFKTLGALDDELFLLGNFLTDDVDNPGLCWIQGPLKKFGDAFEKTMYRDYKGNAVENKDLVRGTIVAASNDPKKNQELLLAAVTRIEKYCVPDYGMNILTPKEKREAKPKVASSPTDKKFLEDCGYSGWNFKIFFNGHPKVTDDGKEHELGDVGGGFAEGTTVPQDPGSGPIPCEIQANTREMMYGKHSIALLLKMKVFKDASEYANHEKAVGFQGGLGHVMYEINRDGPSSPDGLAAAAIARDYHNMCRKVPYGGDKAGLEKLVKDLEGFSAKLTKPDNKSVWDEHYDDQWIKGKALSSGADARKKTW